MALSRRTGQRFQASIWPGFVDAMTGLLLVLMFVLTIFMVIQFVLRETITGQESELDALAAEIVAISEALGLEIKTTPSFTRTGTEEGITSNKKVIDAAFSEDVLKNDLNSAVIELSDNDLISGPKKTVTKEFIARLPGLAELFTAFENEEEAIEIANDTDYGLANYIQTQDKEKANRVARKLR